MKKVIIAFTILFILLTFSVIEIIYTNKVYDELAVVQTKISDEIDKDEKNIDTPQAKALSKQCYEYWLKHRAKLMSLCSHMVMLELDKSIVKQQTLININQYPDCKVETMTIRNMLTELKKTSLPLLYNLM